MTPAVSFLIAVLALLLTISPLRTAVDAIPDEELEAMLAALSSGGYNRIGNAITTSDLSFDFLSAANFTFFAPSDSPLFTLDMTLSADAYLSTLRSHAVLSRLSADELIRLPSSSLLPTLLSNRTLNVTVERDDDFAVTVSVNGVVLERPGLFNGSHVAVHGLRGALLFWSDKVYSGNVSVSPVMPPIPVFQVQETKEPTVPAAIVGQIPRWPPETLINPPPPCCDLTPPPSASQTQIPDVSAAGARWRRRRPARARNVEEPQPMDLYSICSDPVIIMIVVLYIVLFHFPLRTLFNNRSRRGGRRR